MMGGKPSQYGAGAAEGGIILGASYPPGGTRTHKPLGRLSNKNSGELGK